MKQSSAVQTEDFNIVLDGVVSSVMRDLRVCTIARVTEVSPLCVQPIIQEKINSMNGEKYIKLPELRNIIPAANSELSVGDIVACVHLDRSLGEFNIYTNSGYAESNTNRHNLNDAVAIPITGKKYNKLGEYTELAEFDLSKYTCIRLELISETTLMNSVEYCVGNYSYYIGQGNTYAKLTNTGITEITDNTTVIVYAK